MKDLKKITWTSPKELFKNFGVVVIFSAFIAGMTYGIDTLVVAVYQAISSFF